LCCCVLLLGCGGNASRFGQRSLAVLAGATKVEVFRIDPREEAFEHKAGERRIGGYLITAQGYDQGQDFADRLAEILQDDKTFTNDYAKCFNPGVAYRVWKDAQAVEVLLCFMCDNLYCGPPTDRANETASFLGSPRRADLLRLTKEAFPDDKDIQALKDK